MLGVSGVFRNTHTISQNRICTFKKKQKKKSINQQNNNNNKKKKDFICNLINGSGQLDTVICVVSAIEGITKTTKDQLLLCQHIGIPNLIVFINKIDEQSDPELLELIELEIHENVTHYGYQCLKKKIIFLFF